MDGDRIEMSQRERDRLRVLALVRYGKRTQTEAARLAGVTDRTIRRWCRRVAAEGDGGIVHKLRGRRSNHAATAEHRAAVLAAYRQDFGGFGPTLAAEKLTSGGLRVTGQTLRLWLIQEGLWQRRRQRERHRRRRERRPCFGELVQADGSHHDWLEGRGPRMTLLVMIDDATSKVVARFYPGETTAAYMDLLGRWLHKHGRMVSLYTDRHSIFWGQAQDKRPSRTQMKRALEELSIAWIPANSPQAKGRVERFNGTAQDRLVKELRLAGACTLEEANAVLGETFLRWFNRQRTVKPASGNDAHRPLAAWMNLAAILCPHERRKVCNDYTIQVDGRVYQLLKPVYAGQRGGWVTVERRTDGMLWIRFKGHYLKYHQVGPARSEAASGALPPNPRSLPLGRTPAGGRKKEGHAVAAAGPSAVRPAHGRSGRTPALPCPPKGARKRKRTKAWRPPEDHPWKKGFRQRQQRKRTILNS